MRCCGNVFAGRCLAKVESIHLKRDRKEGYIKYAVEIYSGAMMHITSFMKIGSCITNVMWVGLMFTDTQTAQRLHEPTFIR
jgi:hypothetical protein